eukprot:14543522-Alexandrium_andersonii.AAC.1
MEQSWSKHAQAHNITTASCPTTGERRYEAQYAKRIQDNFPGVVPSWRVYMAMKSFMHQLGRLQLTD